MTQVYNIQTRDPGTPEWSKPYATPWVIVSADSHVSLPPEKYGDYLDPKYRKYMGQYLSDIETHQYATRLIGYPFSTEIAEVIDQRKVIQTGGETAYFDPERRIRETEAEGIVAEFLHTRGHQSVVPFFDSQNSLSPGELRVAGARAHNRFLEEYCSEAPGRLLGVPCIYPWPDWAAAVSDCRRAHDAGFKAILPPQQAGAPGDLPAFYDPWWDPLWGTCQDLGLAIHFHAGTGVPQGSIVGYKSWKALGEALDEGSKFDPKGYKQESAYSQAFDQSFAFMTRRPLWQLMWGGVFDRFPALKVSFVEIHGDWVPPTLAYLDARHARGGTPLKLKPSEYWQRHCAVGASLMRYSDVRARHEVGMDQVMFGTDFPHMEGTWPNTMDWIRTVLGDVPRDEARKILGENAIDFYGLDRALLEKAARRVGPFPEQIFSDEHAVDPGILNHFSYRAGINKLPTYDEQMLSEALDEDEKGAISSRARPFVQTRDPSL
jgi:predicted TIM-barrel fold metal-dependent hydrolase